MGTQTLYVTVWELDLFHFFLPLDLPGRWVSNAALAAGLGFTAALFTEGLHRGRKNFTFFVLAACCFLFLPGGRPPDDRRGRRAVPLGRAAAAPETKGDRR